MQTILKIPGFTDNVVTHLFAGLGAGFFAVCIGSPVDVVTYLYSHFSFEWLIISAVYSWLTCTKLCIGSEVACCWFSLLFAFSILFFQVKSRMMGDSAYKSTLDCFIKTLKNDVCYLYSNFF